MINAVAIWIATQVIPQITVGDGTIGHEIGSLLIVGAFFGLINTFVKPLVKLFALPLYPLTLGLISFVVNALMLKIVEWRSGKIGITFDARPFFWSRWEPPW